MGTIAKREQYARDAAVEKLLFFENDFKAPHNTARAEPNLSLITYSIFIYSYFDYDYTMKNKTKSGCKIAFREDSFMEDS